MCSTIRKQIYKAAVCLLLPVIAGCSDTLEPGPGPAIKDDGAGATLRFGVSSSGTRVDEDGVSSSFEDGESVGCVVAFKNDDGSYEYGANTRWEYNAGNGMLLLCDIWSEDSSKRQSWDEANRIIARKMVSESGKPYGEKDGYLSLLEEGKRYAFFFYYPYIDDDKIKVNRPISNSVQDAYSITVPFSTVYFPNGPNYDEWNEKQNIMKTIMTGTVHKEYYQWLWDHYYLYDWRKYPCFASLGQGSKEQSNNSNFMYANCIADPLSGNEIVKGDPDIAHTIRLTFVKKMAAIDVIGAANISDVRFQSDKRVVQGVKIDLSTGVTSRYAYKTINKDNTKTSDFQEEACETTAEFVPWEMAQNRWRLYLPAQTGFECKLMFKADGVERSVDLHKKITSLKENHLYIVRLGSEAWEVIIKDWEKGDEMLIEEEED